MGFRTQKQGRAKDDGFNSTSFRTLDLNFGECLHTQRTAQYW
jgi:hypothetical protein